jgi:hypothetical protein
MPTKEQAAFLKTAAALQRAENLRFHQDLPLSMVTGYKCAASGTDIDHAPPAG